MNFAVIGLGSFGIKRAQAIKNSKIANLFCIYDTNDANAKKAENILKVPIIKYEEILKNNKIDVVCICTPNKFHKKIIVDSLGSNKHVFCEKPLARNINEAKEILDVEEKSNNVLQVG